MVEFEFSLCKLGLRNWLTKGIEWRLLAEINSSLARSGLTALFMSRELGSYVAIDKGPLAVDVTAEFCGDFV